MNCVRGGEGRDLKMKYIRVDSEVPHPSKANEGDVGYDLTMISMTPEGRYSTGIIMEPEEGYHLELVARSSLHKRGYMLSNSIGIIDGGYRGVIEVALYKFDPEAPSLELPCRGVQVIVRKTIHVTLEEVGEVSCSERGAGGFGSSN